MSENVPLREYRSIEIGDGYSVRMGTIIHEDPPSNVADVNTDRDEVHISSNNLSHVMNVIPRSYRANAITYSSFPGNLLLLFKGIIQAENSLFFVLKDGGSKMLPLRFWNLDLDMCSGIFLRVFHGIGRDIRFRNRNTREYTDVRVENSDVILQIDNNTMRDFSIEVPIRLRVQDTSIFNFNFFFDPNSLQVSEITIREVERPEKAEIVRYTEETQFNESSCPICMEEFKVNMQILLPHDHMHPMCCGCGLQLRKLECPICRKVFVI